MKRILLLLSACLALSGPSPLIAQYHLEGEYGLWVTEREGNVHVGWLTDEPTLGLLEVIRNGQRLHRFQTPLSQGHGADFPRPPDGPLLLRYGALDSAGAPPTKLFSTTVYLTHQETVPPSVLTGVDSLFVVGDTHGEYDNLDRLLTSAGLVDAEGHWSGGHKHIVFLGDLFDRGPDVTRNLWFLYRLQREAERAGGGAHVMLGNHETMVFTNDLRYTAPKEKLAATLQGTTYPKLFDIRHSVLGRWLAVQPGMMKIDGILLAHGGVTPQYARWTVKQFDDSLRTFLGEDFFYYLGALYDRSDTTVKLVPDSALAERFRGSRVVVMDSATARRRLDFFFGDSSVFWFRGYLEPDTMSARIKAGGSATTRHTPTEIARDAARKAELTEVLKWSHADIHVVGHTPGETVRSRFGRRLFAVDLNRPASEMLLLVRDHGGGYRAYRYTLTGLAGPVPEDPADIGADEMRSRGGSRP